MTVMRAKMNMLVVFFVVFLKMLTVHGLRPVRDFRVDDLVGPKKQGIRNGVRNVVINTDRTESAASTYSAPTASSVGTSHPTIELSDQVDFLYTDDSNSIYYMNVKLDAKEDSDDVTYPLLFDTGSSITWIYNTSCEGDACESDSVEKFGYPSLSTQTDGTFELSYSGDNVDGSILSLGSNAIKFSLEGCILDNMTIGLASNSPEMFDSYNVSGLLGAPSTKQVGSQKNIVSQMVSEGAADKVIFSLLLTSRLNVKYVDSKGTHKNLPSQYGGLVFFGSKDHKDLVDDIHYTDVVENDNNYWLIDVANIHLANDSNTVALNSSDSSRRAIIDTGTTGIVLPSFDADTLHMKMFGSDYVSDDSGNYAFRCDSNRTIVKLEIGETLFNITAEDIKGDEYTSSDLDGYCASKIQGSSQGDNWVLGTTFLNKYFTVFNIEKKQIGFGLLNFGTYLLQEKKGGDSTYSTRHSSASKGSQSSSTSGSRSNSHKNSTSSSSEKEHSGALSNISSMTFINISISFLICITLI